MKILLAEDDLAIGDAIEYSLKKNGANIDWFTDGELAMQSSTTIDYDLMILDIGLPNKNGFDIIKEVRKQKIKTPILILTALGSVDDRIKGLDLGADDYMVKPFDMDEMHARVRAIHRRNQGISTVDITYKNIAINTKEFSVHLDGKTIDCPKREFLILQKLIENQGVVFSLTQLEDYLYSFDSDIESNTVQVYIHHLRKKFGKNLIRTIRGIGYVIDKA